MDYDQNYWLVNFVRESNRIEGILRDPTQAEFDAHAEFLSRQTITVGALAKFVAVVAPGHVLRDKSGINVRVGDHIAPPGGPSIDLALNTLLGEMEDTDAHRIHIEYETLHPFTDGNGRSGRVLWLWQKMNGPDGGRQAKALGFLHTFYYDTLSASR